MWVGSEWLLNLLRRADTDSLLKTNERTNGFILKKQREESQVSSKRGTYLHLHLHLHLHRELAKLIRGLLVVVNE